MKSSAKRSPKASRTRLRRQNLLLTCEHGGNAVPPELAERFAGADAVLNSHRGMDFGALEVARAFGRRLAVEPIVATVTRLVVDLNRSPRHRNVVSDYTRGLDADARRAAMDKYYWPYRNAVERRVEQAAGSGGFVLHVSAHSFTPVLNGATRNCDVGLLYDPASAAERRFIERWHAALAAAAPQLVIRRNYPYRGTSDALVTHLRRRFGEGSYAGVELEVNQQLVGTRDWRGLIGKLAESLAAAVESSRDAPR